MKKMTFSYRMSGCERYLSSFQLGGIETVDEQAITIFCNGIPIEFCFTPGSTSDIAGLKMLPCELPKGFFLFADRAYNTYSFEDDLHEMAEIVLVPR